MANISAQDINKLRKQTGVGLMDCKNALVEAEGDFDKAIDILRKKGQKVASKRADKEANEGVAIAKTNENNTFAVSFILTCETDFVSKGEEFIDAAQKIVDKAIELKVLSKDQLLNTALENGKTVAELINDLLGKIQEKIEIVQYSALEAPYVVSYNHHNKKIATYVAFNKVVGGIAEAGKDIAMQIAAMAPVAIDENSVETSIIEKELEIARDQIRQEGKPEDMIEKIAQGKLNKFFKENTLVNQQFIKDGNTSVKDYLKSIDNELNVTEFCRLSII